MTPTELMDDRDWHRKHGWDLEEEVVKLKKELQKVAAERDALMASLIALNSR